MLRKITLLTAFLASVVSSAYAQGIKFGVHVDPLLSFMGSNDKKITSDGVNAGFGFGVEMEYYFSEGENYAFTFGGNFALGKGGKLTYANGGKLLPNTTVDNEVFFNNLTTLSANLSGETGEALPLVSGTSIKYNINYLEIPFGLKLRTNELGESYMRAFFHLPIATVMIPVSARGTVDAARPSNLLLPGYYTATPSKGENIYKEIVPIQFMLGTGAGVEYSPNEEGGLRLTGGFYYNYGFLDTVKKNQVFNSTNTGYTDSKARSGFHNIVLRIGIIF